MIRFPVAALAAATLLSSAFAAPSDFKKISSIAESSDRDYVFINAHRGLVDPPRGIAENSYSAITNAIAQGMDIIEVDPKTTRDGRVILSHSNNKLDRLMVFPHGVDGLTTVAEIPYEGKEGEVCFKTWGKDGQGIMPPGQNPPPTMRGYFWSAICWKTSEGVPEDKIRARNEKDLKAARADT